ncbi:MAGE family-domain-containing protein [Lipomyces oligophaga]|uniref:MAGE family-domain-containing protein n=1 Tax=Lipomyces oligophaga TaxID=45792 RepID=UPI0034CF402A
MATRSRRRQQEVIIEDQAIEQEREHLVQEEQEQEHEERQDSDNSTNELDADVPDDIMRMARKLTRLALASGHSRVPIRRSQINEKVLENRRPGTFQKVLNCAQELLDRVAGLELVELPNRTVSKNRSKDFFVQRKSSVTHHSGNFILVSKLGEQYHNLKCLLPREQADKILESQILTVCSIILFSGGVISHLFLKKHLEGLNIISDTPSEVATLSDLLSQLSKALYIERAPDSTVHPSSANADESWQYCIGPRAKVEYPEASIIEFMVSIYQQVEGNKENTAVLTESVRKSLAQARYDLESATKSDSTVLDESSAANSALPSLQNVASTQRLRANRKKNRHDNDQSSRNVRRRLDDDEISSDDDEDDDDEEEDEDDDELNDEEEDEEDENEDGTEEGNSTDPEG